MKDDQAPARTRVKVWRSQKLYGAELLRGSYVGHVYPWHSHEEISLGVVLEGAVSLETRYTSTIAQPGSVVIVNSDQVHRGAATGGRHWQCRTIHLHPNAIGQISDDMRSIGSLTSSALKGPAVHDPAIASALLTLHSRAEAEADPLEVQSRLVTLISDLLIRHGENNLNSPKCAEPKAVFEARRFLDVHLEKKISLEELAQAVNLPPFRILRAFERATGLTPHAYQTQARVRKAYDMILKNNSIADVAAATGFADQAHLTRVFKSIMGATPGQFRSAAA